jgi:S-adenosylmethionine-diacylglycerol 3-amino-3-carboxypropyl transferase
MTLALLGVPQAQRRQVDRYYAGGISRFIEESIDTVFARIPLHDNYFWRVYLTGRYTPTCCPEYLKPHNFHRLKAGLADSIEVHTDTIEGFLKRAQGPFTRFVLLDHMDWLSTQSDNLLQREWQEITRCAAPGARIIWRSGGLKVDYVDPLFVSIEGRSRRLGDLLHYREAEAARLHALDRVHTYGSFYIADYIPA